MERFMILEMARVRILPGSEAEFEKVFYEAVDIISTVQDFRGGALENPLISRASIT
jgi:heme-degrading monooxygenase HmoA